MQSPGWQQGCAGPGPLLVTLTKYVAEPNFELPQVLRYLGLYIFGH